MSDSLKRLEESITKLETVLNNRSVTPNVISSNNIDDLQDENQKLKLELEKLKNDYQILQKTSKEVINELNTSIEVIENYFKEQNANNKDIKS